MRVKGQGLEQRIVSHFLAGLEVHCTRSNFQRVQVQCHAACTPCDREGSSSLIRLPATPKERCRSPADGRAELQFSQPMGSELSRGCLPCLRMADIAWIHEAKSR